MAYDASTLAAYDFEQNAQDSSGNERHATAQGTPTYVASGAWRGSYAASGNSSSGWFTCPTSVITSAGTMEGVFTVPAVPAASKMLWSVASAAGSRAIEIYYFNGYIYMYGNGAGGTNVGFYPIVAGATYYIKDTWSGSARAIWIGQVVNGTCTLTRMYASTHTSVASPTAVYILNNAVGSKSDWTCDWVQFHNAYDDTATMHNVVFEPTATAAGTPTSDAVPLTWTPDTAPPRSRTLIYYNTSNTSSGATLAGASTGSSGSVGGLSASTTYYFFTRSESAGGHLSGYSASVSATTLAAAAVPGTATSVAASATGRSSARVTWVDGASWAFGVIYRGTTATFGQATMVGVAEAGDQSFSDSGLEPNTTYYWWVVGVSANGSGAQAGPASATTLADDAISLAYSTDLAYDLLQWMVQEAVTAGGAANFVNGEVSSIDQQTGKIHLFAAYADDLPSDCGVITATDESNVQEFAPVRKASVRVLLRLADDETTSARFRAQAAGKALMEFTRTSEMEDKTHVALPSGRKILIFQQQRLLPSGMDKSGRHQVLVEFQVQYLDANTQST